VYKRHPDMLRGDRVFEEFFEELRLYLERSKRVFGMRRCGTNEHGKHTYRLNRSCVSGNHKFGKGSILSESERHHLWREAHAKAEDKRRARQRRSARKLKKKRLKQHQEREKTQAGQVSRRAQPKTTINGREGSEGAPEPLRRSERTNHPPQQVQSPAPYAMTNEGLRPGGPKSQVTVSASPISTSSGKRMTPANSRKWDGKAAFRQSLRDQLTRQAEGEKPG
jgi:hypothetical protein